MTTVRVVISAPCRRLVKSNLFLMLWTFNFLFDNLPPEGVGAPGEQVNILDYSWLVVIPRLTLEWCGLSLSLFS